MSKHDITIEANGASPLDVKIELNGRPANVMALFLDLRARELNTVRMTMYAHTLAKLTGLTLTEVRQLGREKGTGEEWDEIELTFQHVPEKK